MTDITLTADEVRALAAYEATQSRFRTYRIIRDTRHKLAVLNPDGRLVPLQPQRDTRGAA